MTCTRAWPEYSSWIILNVCIPIPTFARSPNVPTNTKTRCPWSQGSPDPGLADVWPHAVAPFQASMEKTRVLCNLQTQTLEIPEMNVREWKMILSRRSNSSGTNIQALEHWLNYFTMLHNTRNMVSSYLHTAQKSGHFCRDCHHITKAISQQLPMLQRHLSVAWTQDPKADIFIHPIARWLHGQGSDRMNCFINTSLQTQARIGAKTCANNQHPQLVSASNCHRCTMVVWSCLKVGNVWISRCCVLELEKTSSVKTVRWYLGICENDLPISADAWFDLLLLLGNCRLRHKPANKML